MPLMKTGTGTGFDMLQNIFGVITLVGAVIIGLIFFGVTDLTAYIDTSYIYYGVGFAVLVFGLLELVTDAGELEPFFNMVAVADMIIAALILFITYYYGYLEVSVNFIYALAILSGVWAFAEWFMD